MVVVEGFARGDLTTAEEVVIREAGRVICVLLISAAAVSRGSFFPLPARREGEGGHEAGNEMEERGGPFAAAGVPPPPLLPPRRRSAGEDNGGKPGPNREEESNDEEEEEEEPDRFTHPTGDLRKKDGDGAEDSP